MKVKIQYHTLYILCNLYDAVKEMNHCNPSELHFGREFKAIMNLIDILFLKLKKKKLNKSENSKPFAVNMEYYQAYYLVHFINANFHLITPFFEQNLLIQFSGKLHQQL